VDVGCADAGGIVFVEFGDAGGGVVSVGVVDGVGVMGNAVVGAIVGVLIIGVSVIRMEGEAFGVSVIWGEGEEVGEASGENDGFDSASGFEVSCIAKKAPNTKIVARKIDERTVFLLEICIYI
jgi:hypothetical protein